jgi:hypothetical protein
MLVAVECQGVVQGLMAALRIPRRSQFTGDPVSRVRRPTGDRVAGFVRGTAMTRAISDERFRQAAEAEGGMPVSAGARAVRVRMASEPGRMFYVDLSRVPDEQRSGVIAEIKALVERASARPSRAMPDHSRQSADVND